MIDRPRAVNLYVSGLDLRAVGRELGCSHEAVRLALLEANVSARGFPPMDDWQRLSHALCWQYGPEHTDAIFAGEDAASNADRKAWRGFGRGQ